MKTESSIVFVVDDDQRVRDALSRLISSAGFAVVTFRSATEFLKYEKPDTSACLVLDLQIPGMDGLELQQQLAEGEAPPIIFITGRVDIPSTVRAMKAGAVEFLSKPFEDEELLGAIHMAIDRDRETRRKRSDLNEIRERYALLTSREREVLPFVVGGFANKQAGADLGIAENTIAVHRGQIMRKMGSRSLAELVRMADRLGIPVIDPTG